MKRERAEGDDGERRRDRTPDAKRQRSTDHHQQQQRHRQQGMDSSSRRDERYIPPRRPDNSSSRDSTRRDVRDTPTPHDRRDGRSGASSSHVRPSDAATAGVKLLSEAKETDPHRLAQRQKQIDYGKNTVGYDRYCAAVPKHQRRRHVHPMTPDKTLSVGKKAFDGMIRTWRQALHKYDPPELQDVSEELADASAATSSAGKTEPSNPLQSGEAAPSTLLDAEMAELDPARQQESAATSVPALSIFENFVEGDMDDDDDDDLL